MTIQILHGDCVEVMKTLPDCSVDSVVTDPPYGIRFMGKAWDGADIEKRASDRRNCPSKHVESGPNGAHNSIAAEAGKYDLSPSAMIAFQEFSQAWAREAFRVLKPGGHLLSFASTRTYHRMACGVEMAGFEIRDQIGWLFGSGFPKSLDVGKSIDSRKDWSQLRALQSNVRIARLAAGISQSEAARRMGLIGPGESLGGGGFMWFETGMRVPTREQYTALKAAIGLDDSCDEAFEAAEREVIGHHDGVPGGFTGHRFSNLDTAITAASSDAAKQWEGWGTALKPACVLARKPLSGTVASNVMAHGTGALNIEGCRIETSDDDPNRRDSASADASRDGATFNFGKPARSPTLQRGRWPANLIHDGSDEVLGAFPFASGAKADVHGHEASASTLNMFDDFAAREPSTPRDAGGSAARFFYTAKASRSDRNEGLADPGPQFAAGRLPHDAERIESAKRGNHHPTVKPTELMRYLCRLVTSAGGVVLDPFMGSGSTLKAAELEGFSAIGIELDADYIAIARRRIGADAPLFAEML